MNMGSIDAEIERDDAQVGKSKSGEGMKAEERE